MDGHNFREISLKGFPDCCGACANRTYSLTDEEFKCERLFQGFGDQQRGASFNNLCDLFERGEYQ